MDDKKEALKNLEPFKSHSRPEIQKRVPSALKTPKSKFSMKKVGRSRTQKGHKNY